MPREDIVRVLRILEYEGPRSSVEETIARSIHGEKVGGKGLTIRAATLGTYPEIIGKTPVDEEPTT